MATSTSVSGRSSASIAPLPTPFWFSNGGVAVACQASIVDPAESSNTYCCNGLLIDIIQPILNSLSAQQQPFYFDNLRCCSGDPNVALGSVTTCSTGSEATLATSVALPMSQSDSSGIQTGMGSTSTSTVLSTSDVTTTATAATTSTSDGRGRRVGITIHVFTVLSIILALKP
ncbi:hypothetical protein EG329_011211 [Mollisiaceae sp. DMI_Dod_QoI]|nr:hypothetical protein EG329_011211 [Helotiales sp. DMI_Dod_QoI]